MPFMYGLGTALGGFTAGWQKSQQEAQRAEIQKMLIAQEKNKREAEALTGEALTAGGLPGFGSQSGDIMGMLGGSRQAGAGSAAAPPSGLGSAPPAASPPAMDPGGGRPTGVIPLENTDASQDEATYRGAQMGVPVEPMPQPGREVMPGASASEQSPPRPADAQPPSAALGAGAEPTSGGAPSFDVGQLFQRVDPQAIAARIKELRPNADPGAIAQATERLYKMGQGGDKAQQAQALALLKYAFPTANFTLGEAGRDRRAAATNQTRQDAAAAKAGVDASKLGIARGNLDARNRSLIERGDYHDTTAGIARDRLSQQGQQFQQRIDQAKSIADRGAKDRALRTLLADIQKQLQPAVGNPPTGDALTSLQRQREDLLTEIRKGAGGSLNTPPPPAPPGPSWLGRQFQ